ncbi:Uu.00g020010.m01.CDS01 [Anthostomella pinea]|uniref:Uu.00g020010.m01.CDS01 n=1 Tax=Anthostomella pinea TaxID=933095 RepID=A0AAI8VZF0_9PEZI|nr:Uu.00g020010.m01.CDS01 [Anthostomella pinea]
MTAMSLLSLVACFVAAFAAYRLYVAYRVRLTAQQHGCQAAARYKHKDPVFGLDIFLRTGDAITKNQFLVEHQRRYDAYGHTFEALNFGSRAIYSVHPENLRAVFSKNAADWGIQPLRLRNMSPFCGTGFITADGSDWKISHDLLKPSFHRSNISDFGPLEEHLRLLLEQIPTDGSKFDLQPFILKLYLDMGTLFLFGESIGMLSGTPPSHAQGFLDAFQAGVNGCGLRIALGPLNFLMPKGAWLKACGNVHEFAKVYVDRAIEYRNKISSVEDSQAKVHQRTLLFNMAQQTDDRTILRNQTVQAMMASTETTASLISHVIRNLASNPDICAHVRAEVLALGDAPLDFDQLPRIKSLQHVITETLRLYPVFPQMNRVSLKDIVLPTGGGSDGTAPVFAPAGTLFDTSFSTLHRDPKIWGPDADDFRPSRWENDYSPPPFTFMPFGAGPRQCLAQQKATMETSYVVSRILQEFSGIKSEDEKPYQAQVALTAKSAHGCLVSLTPATEQIVE